MKGIGFIIFFSTITMGYGQSLQDLLMEATNNSASLKAKYLAYEAALQKVPQVGTLQDPELNFGVFARPVETRVGPQRARIQASQMFPWFGTLGAKKDAATEMAKVKYEQFVDARNELHYDVQRAYHQLYAVDASISITQENIAILKTYEQVALTQFENNEAGMIDVLRVQLEMGELETILLNLNEKRKPIVSEFNALLNRQSEGDFPVISNLKERELALDEQAALDSILVNNPKLAGLKHQREVSVKLSEAAKKEGIPSFGLGLSYTVVDKRSDMNVVDNGKDIWMPMLSVKLPIYRKRYKGQIKEQALLKQMAEEQFQNKSNQLNSQLKKAWASLTDAENRLTLYKDQTLIADQILQILVDAYSTGGKDFEEILRVQRLLLKYELESAKALTDKNTSIARIETLY